MEAKSSLSLTPLLPRGAEGEPYAVAMPRIRLALAQIGLVVGDLQGNVERMAGALGKAEADGCDLVAFPELSITGYPPEDLLLKPAFVDESREALDALAEQVGDVVAIVGFVDREGSRLYNAVAVCHGRQVRGIYRKRRLPNYAVFDEQRYFTPGTEPLRLYGVAGTAVGVSICEDAWASGGPLAEQAVGGARLIVNVNASPYHAGKAAKREAMLAERAGEAGCTIAYVNLVGGQDELVFDGGSLVVSEAGEVLARARQHVEELLVVDLELEQSTAEGGAPPTRGLLVEGLTSSSRASDPARPGPIADPLPRWQEIYEALVLGTRDYVHRSGFNEVALGLSGGIDSSLVAAVAVDAFGPDKVHGVLMPSRYSSDHSISDALALAEGLGIQHRTIGIEPAFGAFCEMLGPSFEGTEPGVAEENLQPRIRGTLLMALSNKFGWMVLTTGNKSEMAVGYATLYGDMAGGFAVLKDVPKTWVYEVCRDLNRRRGTEVVPEAVLSKPPSAELRPDQLDTDSLPPYDQLDPIIEAYVERDRSVAQMVAEGHDPVAVERVVRMVDAAEYKRRQAPPGVRVTTKAFGKDRRLPITNLYRRPTS